MAENKNAAKRATGNPMIPNLEADQTAACCNSGAKSKHAWEMFRVAVLSTGGRQSCNSCGQHPPQRGHPIFEFPPVTEETVLKHLLRLSPYKSIGCAVFTNRVLKQTAPFVARSVTYLFNLSLNTAWCITPRLEVSRGKTNI